MGKMQRLIKSVLYLVAMFGTLGKVHSQDLHFSQYFHNPLFINPANTGFSPDDDWRVGLQYRNQWNALSAQPYRTMSAWGDVQLFNNRLETGWVGLGGGILSDRAGQGSLTATRSFANIAYHQQLGLGSLLSVGFSSSYTQKRIDPTRLTFDNQWNGKFFDVNIPSGESFATTNVGYFALQAGLNYAYFPSDRAYFNVGVSVANLNAPKESFLTANSNADVTVPMRYNVFLNGSFKLNDQWIINPNIYYSQMAGATETVVGFNAQYNLTGDGSKQLLAGLYARVGDAVAPMVGYQLNNYKIMVSYDATVSSLSTFNRSNGAYELGIVKSGVFSSGKAVKCPTVKF